MWEGLRQRKAKVATEDYEGPSKSVLVGRNGH